MKKTADEIIAMSNLPYIILVKQFTGSYYSVPSAGTKAYSFPQAGSSVVYTFPTPTSSTKFVINSVVYCSGYYWAKFCNLGDNSQDGYVKCSDISLDYTTYADPDNQTPNSQIGKNTTVIFNMWYFPIDSIHGVDSPIPLYYQYYYNNTRINSGKCALLASISGKYKYSGTYYDPTIYLTNMTNSYWTSSGLSQWLATMSRTTSKTVIRQKAKTNLDNNKPFLVGAKSMGGTNHLVVVAGYRSSGQNYSDYIVLDSCLENFSTLDDFFTSYPNYADWTSIGGTGYVYGEY